MEGGDIEEVREKKEKGGNDVILFKLIFKIFKKL